MAHVRLGLEQPARFSGHRGTFNGVCLVACLVVKYGYSSSCTWKWVMITTTTQIFARKTTLQVASVEARM